MKKHLLLFALVIIIGNAIQAQITISQWDVANVGTQLLQANDTVKSNTIGSLSPGSSGANQTWNFSSLLSGWIDTLTFTNPAWLANGSNFPTSNLAVINSTDSSVAYLKNSSTGLYVEGVYGNFAGFRSIKFKPTEEIIAFNDTFNTSFSNKSGFSMKDKYTQQAGIDSIKVSHTKTKTSKTDAWGTVTTPLGNFSSLRHKEKVITIDSIFVHVTLFSSWVSAGAPTVDTSWHFSWWANNAGFPLVEFDSIANDTIRNITWLKVLPYPGAVNEVSQLNALHTYPNPASDHITFEIKNTEAYRLELFDLNGKRLSAFPTNKTNRVTINVEEYSQGIYFYRLTDKNQNTLNRGKFNIVR